MPLHGRIMGATGILAGAIWPASRYYWTWRAEMPTGMVAGPWVYFAFAGGLPAIEVPSAAPLLTTALIVGIIGTGAILNWDTPRAQPAK